MINNISTDRDSFYAEISATMRVSENEFLITISRSVYDEDLGDKYYIVHK